MNKTQVSRKIRLAGLALLVLLIAGWQRPQSSDLPTVAEVNSVLKEISAITGFRVRKQRPFEMITRDQVNDYLKQEIKQSVKLIEIARQRPRFGYLSRPRSNVSSFSRKWFSARLLSLTHAPVA